MLIDKLFDYVTCSKFDVRGSIIYCGNINDNHKISHNIMFSHFPHRLDVVKVRLSQSQGLGPHDHCQWQGSQNGNVPIYVKHIQPSSVLEADGKLKSRDKLVAVNKINAILS